MRSLFPLAGLAVLLMLSHCSSSSETNPDDQDGSGDGEESGSDEGGSGDGSGSSSGSKSGTSGQKTGNSGAKSGSTGGGSKSGSATSGGAKSGSTSGGSSSGAKSGSTSGGKSGSTSGAKSGSTSGSTTNANAAIPPAHGFLPSKPVIDKTMAQRDYIDWKKYHYEECGGDEARVKFDTPTVTVSEGIAYGMLGAVANDDEEAFKKLRNYYFKRVNGNGLMNWKINGCTTSPTGDGQNAATDADLDVAYALIQAKCKGWSGAEADALKLLDAIRTKEVDGSVLKPGDAFGGANEFNPSYFSPAYYRVFAEFQPAQASFWTKLATDTYPLLEKCANKTSGFVPDWCDSSGQPTGRSKIYGYDAARTPWRVGLDYLWYGTAQAKAFNDRIVKFIDSKGGPTKVQEMYELNGTSTTTYPPNSTYSGAFAFAAMGVSQAAADLYGGVYKNVPGHADNGAVVKEGTNVWIKRGYFHASLRVVYSAFMVGLLQPTCGG